jgi:hypothetical protein
MSNRKRCFGIDFRIKSVLLGAGLAIAVLCCLPAVAGEAVEKGSPQAAVATPDGAAAALGRLPLAFVENRGQWNSSARFIVRQGAMTARLEQDRVTLALADDGKRKTVVSLIFEDANEDVVLEGKGRQRGRYNYLIGADKSKWRTGVRAYSIVLYRGLHDGIDLRLRDGGGILEYDLLVRPGADPGEFVVRCEGTEGLEIDPDGSLVLATPFGPLRQKPPLAWQETAAGERIPVECRYRKVDEILYTFDIPELNPDDSLVIDPGLVWSSFLGGTFLDSVNGIAVNDSGKVFLTGWTESSDFPTKDGFDETFNGSTDIFVACMDPKLSGDNQLEWSTFLGGSHQEVSNNVALDATGAVTISGSTLSSDFPTTTGAYSTTHNGDRDAVAARLDPTGSVLLWSTYLGGSGEDYCGAMRTMALAPSGVVVLTGCTASTDFPTTADAYDLDFNGGDYDAFISYLDPALTGTAQLVDSTYIGGSAWDTGQGIAVDAAGVATISGWTDSTDFPTTAGAFDTSHNGGTPSYLTDAYVTRLDPSQSGAAQLEYSTFYGGTGGEGANSLAMDAQGIVTITGSTESSDLPTTSGSFSPGFNGPDWDGFVAWFDLKGAGQADLLYGTYLGGATNHDYGYDLVVDDAGVATVTGVTASGDFPTTSDAYDPSHNGYEDVIVSRLTPDHGGAGDLAYSTFLGGWANDLPFGIGLTRFGQPVVGGRTYSNDFPTTGDAYSTTNAGNFDGFITWLSTGEIVPDVMVNGSDSPITITQGTNLLVEVELDPGDCLGLDADWWLAVSSPFGWRRFDVSSGRWVPGAAVTYQGSLFAVGPKTVFNSSLLPAGTYTFHFGVDMDMNGQFTAAEAVYDIAEVIVQ